MKKEILSQIGRTVVYTVLEALSEREEKRLSSDEKNYLEGFLDMAFILKKISPEEKNSLMFFITILS